MIYKKCKVLDNQIHEFYHLFSIKDVPEHI